MEQNFQNQQLQCAECGTILNSQQKSKNFMRKKVIHPQKDVLNAAQNVKHKTITAGALEKEDTK